MTGDSTTEGTDHALTQSDDQDDELSTLQLAADTLTCFPDVLGDSDDEGMLDSAKIDDYEEFDVGDFDFKMRSFLKRQLKQKLFKSTPKRVLLRDKISFVLGTAHLWLGAYWLGCCRHTFYKLYSIKAIVLFSARFFLYKYQKMHYYFFDFCYFANALLLFFLWVMPTSSFLLKVSFAYNTGILAWSIVAFRNSLVFHSLDKVTSLFLHYYPMVVSWTLRWYPDCNRHGTCEDNEKKWEKASSLELILYPLPLYLCWATMYYLKIFVFSEKRIQQRGYATLFKYMTSNKKTAFAKFMLRFPRHYQPIVFLGIHLSFCLVCLVLGVFCWNSYWVHTILISGLSCVSVWNGANFYFEVFANKYVQSVRAKAE